MARNIAPSCRQCRREGTKLYLKGEKCTSKSCPFEKRPFVPGQHGMGRKKFSGYGIQLREKQKVKRAYGLLENQFYSYYVEAERLKGVTGENMLKLLEKRLDNVVYRMGIGSSRKESRQIVSHGNILVNGNVVDIPSYQVKKGDEIEIKESRKTNKFFTALKGAKLNTPKWVEFNTDTFKGKIVSEPARDDIDLTIQEHLIVELYSK